jgi:acetyltransferase-like isoleucine patch superfamily enzyme
MMRIIVTKLMNWFFHLKSGFLKNGLFIGKFSNIKRSTLFGNNAVGNRTIILKCEVGKGTYFGNNCNFTDTKIGNFCSIGNRVEVTAAQHPIREFISTSPLFYTTRNQCKSYIKREKFPNFKYLEGTKYKAVIGNDVWIGNNVIIIGGIRISDGAVVAAGAVVTKNVEPYEIVGGVPAKHISYRFDSKTIETLIQIQWWKKSDEWLSENAELFSNINLFIEKFGK